MATHVLHPDTLTHGLSDECPECKRKAKMPLQTLDAEHVADLWARMLAVEFKYPEGTTIEHYRSAAEGDACRVLYGHARFLELLGVNPRPVVLGFRRYALEPAS